MKLIGLSDGQRRSVLLKVELSIGSKLMGKLDPIYLSECELIAKQIASSSSWTSDRLEWIKASIIGRHKSDLIKLSGYVESGQTAKAMRYQRRILQSFAGRSCGLLLEFYKMKKRGNLLPKLSWEEFERQVQSLPIRTGKPDPIHVYTKAKRSGGQRVICSPGLGVRASQHLVSRVIEARAAESEFEHNCSGRGRTAAVQNVKSMLLDGGRQFVVLFDIKDFFPSVKPKHLAWLSLPNEIIRSSICFTENVSLSFHYNKGETKMALQGLPQGAPASAKLASAFLGRELRRLGEGLGIVTYVDDGVIGACSHDEALLVAKALSKRMSNTTGGPIGFRKLEVRDAREGFPFLGYYLRLVSTESGVQVNCTPSHAAKQRAKTRLFGRLRKQEPNLDYDTAVERALEYIKSWRASFTLWEQTSATVQILEDEVLTWVDEYLAGWTKKQQPKLYKPL